MLRAGAILAGIFLLVAAFAPWPSTSGLQATPYGDVRSYLPSVVHQSAGNPTATPVPNATTTPSGVVSVQDNHSWYFNDSLDDYFVVGEVENGTDEPIELISLLITFYDGSGTPVYSDTTFVKGEQLKPREKSCFLLIADGLDTGWSRYDFSRLTYYTYTDNVPMLSLANVTGQVVVYDTYEEYEVRGTVRNQTSSMVPLTEMVGTLYNAQGTVVDCGFAWEYDIVPGGSESFAMEYSFRKVYAGFVNSFHVIPTGDFGNFMSRSSAAQQALQNYREAQNRQLEYLQAIPKEKGGAP